MDNGFELLDPHAARAFLKSFGSTARRAGEALFGAGRVHNLEPSVPGQNYSASVQAGNEAHEVELDYDAEEGWVGACSCSQAGPCEHLYAAMRALVAEHNTATVRNLSAGVTSAVSAAFLPRPEKKPAPEDGDLGRRLSAALGRPLEKAEAKFVRQVRAVYSRCSQSRRITTWDFNEMGLAVGGYGWDALKIWPSLPSSEYEFWLYVANAMEENHAAIPEFMEPITDLAEIRKRMARWRRGQEIDKWKHTLGEVQIHPAAPAHAGSAKIDLRLAIFGSEARMQWHRLGTTSSKLSEPANWRKSIGTTTRGASNLEPNLRCSGNSSRGVFTSAPTICAMPARRRSARWAGFCARARSTAAW